jgi:hypothetical protein
MGKSERSTTCTTFRLARSFVASLEREVRRGIAVDADEQAWCVAVRGRWFVWTYRNPVRASRVVIMWR